MALKSGDQLGNYSIVSNLSTGSFGAVYSCVDPAGVSFAIKVPKTAGADFCQLEEARLLTMLEHQNIVRCRAAWQQPLRNSRYLPEQVQGKRVLVQSGEGFVVDNSELQSPAAALGYRASCDLEDRTEDSALWGSMVKGDMLDGWLHVELTRSLPCLVMDLWHCDLVDVLQKTVSEPAARRLGGQMAEALAYLHSRGILHRDVKAENFLVNGSDLESPSCIVALTDFGLAVKSERHSEQCGNQLYWAPEIYAKSYGAKADVWALGITICLLLDTHFPFVSEAQTCAQPLALRSATTESMRCFMEDLLAKEEDARLSAAAACAYLQTVDPHCETGLIPTNSVDTEVERLDETGYGLFCQCLSPQKC